MQIDPRLNKIDDCLYRVAVRMLAIQDSKVLLVQEIPEMWWAFPGGGVNHGETIETSLTREIEEELGVSGKDISSDFRVVYYNIGNVVKTIPRMNLFYKVSLPKVLLRKTDQVAKWGWFSNDEFLNLNLNPSYDKDTMAKIIFDN